MLLLFVFSSVLLWTTPCCLIWPLGYFLGTDVCRSAIKLLPFSLPLFPSLPPPSLSLTPSLLLSLSFFFPPSTHQIFMCLESSFSVISRACSPSPALISSFSVVTADVDFLALRLSISRIFEIKDFIFSPSLFLFQQMLGIYI